MPDIFISTLPTLLNSWSEAFPQSTIATAITEAASDSALMASKNEATIFWLHMNEDRQQWMTNTIASISQSYKDAKIVVLANMPNQAESLHALGLGAMGYCHAYTAPAVLKEIKAVINHGGLWLGQDILQRLIEVSTKLIGNRPEYVDGLLAQLTKREKEVAVEAAKGLSNKEIARLLIITERTVKAHLASTFERLGAKDRLQLALMLNSNYSR
jgi:DNA-binding NarL/FixJ family response regulator